MTIIHVRKNDDNTYTCYGTVMGYDYSFTGYMLENAKDKMRAIINNFDINPAEVKWDFSGQYAK